MDLLELKVDLCFMFICNVSITKYTLKQCNNTTLIMFAVIAAFGLVMATAVVLPIAQQVQARSEHLCKNTETLKTPPCGKNKQA
jgi:hypothetical protein